MNSLGILQALAFEPKKAFTELDARPRVLFPLVLLIVSTVAIQIWYFSVVDIAWLVEESLSAAGGQVTDQQAQAARSVGAGVLAGSSVVGTLLLVPLLRVLEAVYYLLMGKITNVQRDFKHWMALACWSSLPAVLACIPSAIVLLTASSAQIDQGAVQPLSLNSLFFHRTAAEPGYSFLATVHLLNLVGMFLATLGVRAWSGRSWLFSVAFTIVPILLIAGPLAYYALGRS